MTSSSGVGGAPVTGAGNVGETPRDRRYSNLPTSPRGTAEDAMGDGQEAETGEVVRMRLTAAAAQLREKARQRYFGGDRDTAANYKAVADALEGIALDHYPMSTADVMEFRYVSEVPPCCCHRRWPCQDLRRWLPLIERLERAR